MRRFLLIVVAAEMLLSWGTFASQAQARTEMTRTEIRTMPIHDRPYRAGHFYGNTVRRRGSRGGN